MAVRWIASASSSEAAVPKTPAIGLSSGRESSAPSTEATEPMDLERALDEFEGDRELLAEVVEGFIENVVRQVGIMRESLDRLDAETVIKEAHAIKGGAGGLAAWSLSGWSSGNEGFLRSESPP